MNEKIYISRKYNKLLNILLGIYVTLCLVLSLLFNGFFVKTKAFTDNISWELEGTCINNVGYGTVTQTVRKTSVGNTRAIYYVDDEFTDILNNQISANNSTPLSATCILIRANERDLNGSITSEVISSSGGGSVPPFRSQSFTLDLGSELYNYFLNKGVELGKINNRVIWGDFEINGTVDSSPDNIYTANFASDVQYVDNPQDLYDYLINNDDSVVKYDDPNNPTEPIVDNSLPVPQNVHFLDDTIDKQTGEIYNLKIGWDNPSNASFDALESDKLKVQVQVNAKTYYVDGIVNKPTNRVYNNFDTNNEFDLFNPLMKQNLNAYFSRGSENDGQIKAKYEEGFGEYLDEGYCFYQDLKLSDEYRKLGAPSQRSQLIAGTTFKIRYKYEDNVSLWVNLRLSKNPTSWTDLPLYTDTSFSDNQDNNVDVSSNASGNGFYYNSNPYSPYYNSIVYPNSNSSNKSANSSRSSNSSSGLGNILSGIGSIFGAIGEFFSSIFTGIGELVSSIKGLFSGENDSGGFFGFFGSLFQEFPFLLTFLTLGIAITVLLRIIGR